MSYAAVVTTTCFVAVAVLQRAGAVTRHPLVMVVSFDSLHADNVRPDAMPNLCRFRDASAAPPYMRPAFPTKTFVNHFTIATGLHPEQHGVLDNYMFDRHNKTTFHTYEQFHYDEAVVPLWMENENNGDGRYSGVMMWPGSSFPYQGKTPTFVEQFNNKIPWTSCIDKTMLWIKDKTKPANLVFLYFDEPDNTAHVYGIGSRETNEKIAKVDETIRYLLSQIKKENLENKVNLIILSDHGMETVTYDKIIYLDKYVSSSLYKGVFSGSAVFVNPNPGKFDEIYKKLKSTAISLGTFNAYRKDEIPDRWHMKNNTRLTGIIFLLAKPGYLFIQTTSDESTKENFRRGMHGYDNEDPKMHAVFMASGPAFKKNFIARPFDNIDVHPLISHVLNLKVPAASLVRPNQNISGVEQLLLLPKSPSSAASSTPLVQGGRKIIINQKKV